MEKQITGKLQIVERMKNSLNGNPRYLLLVGDLLLRTKPDAQLGYSITNYDGDIVTATVVEYRGKLAIEAVQS